MVDYCLFFHYNTTDVMTAKNNKLFCATRGITAWCSFVLLVPIIRFCVSFLWLAFPSRQWRGFLKTDHGPFRQIEAV